MGVRGPAPSLDDWNQADRFEEKPDTLRERARFVCSEGTKSWDRILVMIVGFFGPIATMIVAGLDHRFGWSTVIPEVG